MVTAIIVAFLIIAAIAAGVFVYLYLRNKRQGGGSHVRRSTGNIISVYGVGTQDANRAVPEERPAVAQRPTSSGTRAGGLHSRFVAMGVLLAAVFGSLSVKLWSLQILENETYSEKARQNLYTNVTTQAPRGVIYDADGTALVDNVSSISIVADSDVADNHDVVQRLSVVLGIPFGVVRSRILDSSNGSQTQRVVASDASIRNAAFITEHTDAFPGVSIQQTTTRHYRYGALAAHVLGYTGTVTDDQLNNASEGRTLASGDQVGQSGIEQQYDDLLAGDHGVRTLIVDSSGNVQQVVGETNPSRGSDLYLTLRGQVQQAADNALRECIDPADGSTGHGRAGALVCMDVTNGEIIALSSYPTFDPNNFVNGISQDVWDKFNTEGSYYPLINRAIGGEYPLASTFKSFTGMAGLKYGFANSTKTWTCTGTWTGFGKSFAQKCWKTGGHGTLDFKNAIIQSCDSVFYEIAKDFYEARGTIGDDAMQDYVKKFGFNKTTGIDLSGESEGRIPTPEWKSEYFKDAPEEAQWLPGDMTNMVIGQGYVLGTMLQLAVAYGAIATGGNLVKPHLLKQVRNSSGDVVIQQDGGVDSTIDDLNKSHLNLLKQGLIGVVENTSQISSTLSGYKVAGKTGTAEQTDKNDHALFACFGPYDDPKYVVTCIIEEGEAGGSIAAPTAAKVMKAALQYNEGTLKTKMSSVEALYSQRSSTSGSSGRSD
ncbi:MAG: penicillin-binding protein 2 [Eggerthellaceae bacterium]|jgi:penicillin-binding protein 2